MPQFHWPNPCFDAKTPAVVHRGFRVCPPKCLPVALYPSRIHGLQAAENLMPEWEELAATSAAVQNLHLMATAEVRSSFQPLGQYGYGLIKGRSRGKQGSSSRGRS